MTENRVRARDLGVPLDGAPGPLNAITDVPGVSVGMVTVIEGDRVRTGVTAILPRPVEHLSQPCAAATYSLNGNGELTGRTWIDEAGMLTTPVMLTATHSVGAVHAGTHAWLRAHRDPSPPGWALPVVGETWDGYLNDDSLDAVTADHALQALESAEGGPLEEGNVGGGTGMNAFGFKAGTGTSSRRVAVGAHEYTVGVLVQANHGRRDELTIVGRRVGSASAAPCPIEDVRWLTGGGISLAPPPGSGSIIAIIATDAPLLPGQLAAMARRVPLGLARHGTSGGHFSGDIFLAFSTANAGRMSSGFSSMLGGDLETIAFTPWGRLDDLYEAVVQGVEEAVINALVAAVDMVGRDGHFSPRLPHSEVTAAMRSRLR